MLGALALPAQAAPPRGPAAGTASVVGSTLSFTAAAGDINRVAISTDGSEYTVADSGTPLTAGPGCTSAGPNTATCTGVVTDIEVTLGDRDDSADLSGVPKCGPDTPGCGEPASVVGGGDGNDALTGGGGDDRLEGDAGNDTLVTSPNDDRMVGGAGTDTADYSSATAVVVVTLGNNTADDGQNGIEFDDTATENVVGGSGDDNLKGDPGPNAIQGGPGDDRLDGLAGADDLSGGSGSDLVDYSQRRFDVTADLEGDADDGESGEGDLIRTDIETLVGGDANDTLNGAGAADTILGGLGQDSLHGGPGDDLLDGEDGNDALRGDDGEDTLLAGRGEDYLDGGAGPDLLTGGAGMDVIDYSRRGGPLLVDFYSVGLDGEPGENDIVRPDIEIVEGGSGNDKFTGTLAGVTLNGNGGDDTLQGSGGDDSVSGGAGKDTTAGGGGNDTVTGGPGTDALAGGNGDDSLHARDGARDTVECGAGADFVEADPTDVIESDCDKIDRGVGPALTLPTGRLKVSAKRIVKVRVGCPARTVGNCTGTVTIQGKRPRRRYGRKAFEVAPGKARQVSVRVSTAAVRLIRSRGTLACTLIVAARDGAGNRSTRRRAVTLV